MSSSLLPLGLAHGLITLSGWFEDEAGRPAKAVRIRLGRRLIICASCNQPASPAPSKPLGFTAEFRVGRGFKFLRVEAESEDGRTHLIGRRLLFSWRRASTCTPSDYALWRDEDARLNPPAPAPAEGPLVSVLMPVHDTPARWLLRAIESVRAQTYAHWQLCIADDASTAPHLREMLRDFAASDSRIRVTRLAQGGHISRATNAALALAEGEFVAFLDHDDELAPHALAEIARAAITHPGAALFYTDEDKLDSRGRHIDPYFKPAWNPDLLRSQNYLCHLVVLRANLVRRLGGLRPDYDGAQDWDLVLRATESLPASAIIHVPRVLYHWRAAAGSTAVAASSKSYARSAAERALRDHLARTGVRGAPSSAPGGHWRILRAPPARPPRVSLLVPTRDRADLLRRCVATLLDCTDYPDLELILIDNGTAEPAALAELERLRARGARILRDDGPFNYSALNNRAADLATGEILGLVNNDVQALDPGWLRELVTHALRPEIGAVGPRLLYPDGRLQHAGVVLGLAGPRLVDGIAGHAFRFFSRSRPGHRNRARVTQNYSAATGACLLVRRSVFQEVGGLDADHFAVDFNDVDFCLRLQAAGYRNVFTPHAELVHHESASRGLPDTPEKIARHEQERSRMRERWGPLLDHDPAYNPNLTLVSEDFALAWPPRPARSAR